MNLNNNELRKDIRQRRRRLGLRARLRSARLLSSKIRSLAQYQSSSRIAVYLASDGELDCQFLIHTLWKDGKCCFLPVIQSFRENKMAFVVYRPGCLLKKNRFSIREPELKVFISAHTLDLVVVPLVAVDGQGNRVGMGGGYYDRAFATANNNKRAILVGVGYWFQQVGLLHARPWDVQMNKVIVT